MPDLKLQSVLEATEPGRLRPLLEPFFGPGAEPRVETTRLQAPLCFWVVYRSGDRRVTLKTFFAESSFADYRRQLEAHYAGRIGQPEHPAGGIVLAPELNAVLWSFPFDPVMPGLRRCLDGAWVAAALRRRSPTPLEVEVLRYRPEIGATLVYRAPGRRRPVAYGKATAAKVSGLVYAVLGRLWRSPARVEGQVRIPRPLAYRPEAGLLLQGPVGGRPVQSQRNRVIFRDLVDQAASTLAALHDCDVPFGRPRSLDHLLARLDAGLEELALTAPPLHRTLRRLIEQIRSRARRSEPGRPVPSHGDYKWDQFLHWRGRFSLIDFELFCQAEAAFDAGYFCAYLPPSAPADWRDGAAVELLRSRFLRAYAEQAPEPLDFERVGLYEAASLGVRSLGYVYQHQQGWHLRAAQMLDLAFDRLVSPAPEQVS